MSDRSTNLSAQPAGEPDRAARAPEQHLLTSNQLVLALIACTAISVAGVFLGVTPIIALGFIAAVVVSLL